MVGKRLYKHSLYRLALIRSAHLVHNMSSVRPNYETVLSEVMAIIDADQALADQIKVACKASLDTLKAILLVSERSTNTDTVGQQVAPPFGDANASSAIMAARLAPPCQPPHTASSGSESDRPLDSLSED